MPCAEHIFNQYFLLRDKLAVLLACEWEVRFAHDVRFALRNRALEWHFYRSSGRLRRIRAMRIRTRERLSVLRTISEMVAHEPRRFTFSIRSVTPTELVDMRNGCFGVSSGDGGFFKRSLASARV